MVSPKPRGKYVKAPKKQLSQTIETADFGPDGQLLVPLSPGDVLLTPQNAMAYVGIRPRTLSYWIKMKWIKPLQKKGTYYRRFKKSDLDALLGIKINKATLLIGCLCIYCDDWGGMLAVA